MTSALVPFVSRGFGALRRQVVVPGERRGPRAGAAPRYQRIMEAEVRAGAGEAGAEAARHGAGDGELLAELSRAWVSAGGQLHRAARDRIAELGIEAETATLDLAERGEAEDLAGIRLG